jgi:HK97 family phage prohead protease
MSDVIMQYDHRGRVFARIRNNTLELRTDAKGLFVSANLGGTEIGRQLYEEIRGGYTDKMSFAFTVSGDRLERFEENNRRVYLRTITQINKVFDVSAVSIPANDGTSISARSFVDGILDKEKADALAAEQRRRQIQKIRILMEVTNGN